MQRSKSHDFITKLCRQQAQVTRSHENAEVFNTGQAKSHAESMRLKPGGGQAYDRSSD